MTGGHSSRNVVAAALGAVVAAIPAAGSGQEAALHAARPAASVIEIGADGSVSFPAGLSGLSPPGWETAASPAATASPPPRAEPRPPRPVRAPAATTATADGLRGREPDPDLDAARARKPAARIPPRLIADAASAADLAPALVEAISYVESRHNPRAVSPKGAIGAMQLMPGTARDLAVNPWDPAQNVRGGAVYLRQLLDAHHGDVVAAIAAYNSGPAAVRRYGGVPPFPETRAYVAAVLDRLATQSTKESPR